MISEIIVQLQQKKSTLFVEFVKKFGQIQNLRQDEAEKLTQQSKELTQRLREVVIESINLEDEYPYFRFDLQETDLLPLFSLLAGTGVKNLNLSCNRFLLRNLSEDQCQLINTRLKETQIESIDLSHDSVQTADFPRLICLFSGTSVKNLSLRYNHIELRNLSKGECEQISAQFKATQIESINFENGYLYDADFLVLLWFLLKGAPIKNLILPKNMIELNIPRDTIRDTLHFTSLESLDLSGNEINDKNALNLHSAFNINESLPCRSSIAERRNKMNHIRLEGNRIKMPDVKKRTEEVFLRNFQSLGKALKHMTQIFPPEVARMVAEPLTDNDDYRDAFMLIYARTVPKKKRKTEVQKLKENQAMFDDRKDVRLVGDRYPLRKSRA